RQLTRAVRQRLETQMSERERIARDLHDTLLQDVTGLLLRFHAVSMRVDAEPVRHQLDDALSRGDEILLRARDTVSGLRTDASGLDDLAQSLTAFASAQENANGSTAFHVTTDGSPRRIRPIIRDEIFHVAREAVLNAYRHARATRVDVELSLTK